MVLIRICVHMDFCIVDGEFGEEGSEVKWVGSKPWKGDEGRWYKSKQHRYLSWSSSHREFVLFGEELRISRFSSYGSASSTDCMDITRGGTWSSQSAFTFYVSAVCETATGACHPCIYARKGTVGDPKWVWECCRERREWDGYGNDTRDEKMAAEEV